MCVKSLCREASWLNITQFRYLGHDAQWKHASCRFVQTGEWEWTSVTEDIPTDRPTDTQTQTDNRTDNRADKTDRRTTRGLPDHTS